MEPDLSHSITMHPHPFRTQSQPPSVRRLNTVSPGASSGGPHQTASSTAFEALDGADDTSRRHHSGAAKDVEVESQRTGRFPLVGAEHDPYGLSTKYKSESELAAIRTQANMSRKRDALHADAGNGDAASTGSNGRRAGRLSVPLIGRSANQARRVHSFYQTQNETIERLLKSVEEHRADARQEHGEDQLKFK